VRKAKTRDVRMHFIRANPCPALFNPGRDTTGTLGAGSFRKSLTSLQKIGLFALS
jgi:hypothetical protein